MTDPLAHCDPVGRADIIERLGVTKNALDQWEHNRKRHPFPKPARHIGRSPLWAWSQVVEWCEATDRHALLAHYQPETQETT